MAFEVGDKVHHIHVAPGFADTEVIEVGECTNEFHANEEGGPCGQPTITVNDPIKGGQVTMHADNFVKVEET